MTAELIALLVSRGQDAMGWQRSHMETEGFRVLVATDGPSALGSVRRQRRAVVLLSVILPTAAVRVDDPSGGR
jgi:DNA-binding response OmpR family regulator